LSTYYLGDLDDQLGLSIDLQTHLQKRADCLVGHKSVCQAVDFIQAHKEELSQAFAEGGQKTRLDKTDQMTKRTIKLT